MPNKELMNIIIKRREAKEQKIKSIESSGYKLRDGEYVNDKGDTISPPWKKNQKE